MKNGLYGIVGMFNEDKFTLSNITGFQTNFEGKNTKFGGYFTLLDTSFEGELTDLYGKSKIEGILVPRKMTFVKKYLDRKDEIQCTLQLNDGIWVGGWTFDESAEEKNITCNIFNYNK